MCARPANLFWHFYGSAYDTIWDSPLTARLNDELLSAIARCLHELRDLRVVDLGCGTGLSARSLSRAGCHVIGIDSEPVVLERAQAKGWLAESLLGDVTATGLSDSCTDIAVLSNLLQACADPVAALDEAARLVGSGTLVVVWPRGDLTLGRLLHEDRRAGRPALSALLAHLGRIGFGLMGAMVRARSWSSSALDEMLDGWADARGWKVAERGSLGRISSYRILCNR